MFAMHGYPYLLRSTPKLVGAFTTFATPDGGINECLGPSEKRRCIVFSADLINASNIVVRPKNARTDTFGFNVVSGQPPVILRYEDVGSLVQGAWQAQSAGIGQVMMMMECLEE